MTKNEKLTIRRFIAQASMASASLIGGIPETQEVIHYCADSDVRPTTQIRRTRSTRRRRRS